MGENVWIDPRGMSDRIWRYMNFAEFVWLLSKRALWFTRVDRFDDKWEAFCLPTLPPRPEHLHPLQDVLYSIACGRAEELSQLRRSIYVSCWSLGDQDSYPMWRAYTDYGYGVAVQSTPKRVIESMESTDAAVEVRPMWSAPIEYQPEDCIRQILTSEYDFGKGTSVGAKSLFRPAFLKRSFFSGEREWRVAIHYPGMDAAGLERAVSLETLIENVFLPATAQQFFIATVRSVLEKYGVRVRPLLSGIGSQPLANECSSGE